MAGETKITIATKCGMLNGSNISQRVLSAAQKPLHHVGASTAAAMTFAAKRKMTNETHP
jgi:hypothetical protein